MKNKIMVILVLSVFVLISIAGVSASDASDGAIASEDTSKMELSQSCEMGTVDNNLQTFEEKQLLMQSNNEGQINQTFQNKLRSEGEGTYLDLITEIGDGGYKNLINSYYRYNGGETFVINTSGVIDGNGAVIDMAGSNIQALKIDTTGVTIKNLTIINVNYVGDGGAIYFSSSGTVINCNFTNNTVSNWGTNTTLTLNSAETPTVVKVASHFDIPDRAITLNGYAVDTDAGEEGIYYATTLLDADGKPIANAYIEFAVNNKIYNRTTYENGSFKPYRLNMKTAGRYTMAFNFAENDNYTSAFACVCVDLDKKPITIKASAKSYKASVKTKKYTVTLSTIVGSSHDGKAHLKSGMKVTLTVNGKTFTGKTNSKGKVTFKITNLTKKGKYTAKISYKGDKTYNEATKKAYITIK